MPITTHAELLTAIGNYTARDDLTSVDDDFVLLCEARLNHGAEDREFNTPPLRHREMENRATATMTGEYLALPTDFLSMISVRVTSTASPRMLRPMVTGSFDSNLDTSRAGTPVFYDIIGDELRLQPAPTSGTLEMIYYQNIPPLASNSPNWLLTAYPNIYLYGSLLEASIYMQNDNDILKYARLFSGVVEGANDSGRDASVPTPLVARSDHMVGGRRYARI